MEQDQCALAEFSERAYLDYAMYVILDRALPHIGDGLKPVQRRIIYAMSELGLTALSKHKKSARTVGDVLGKFHPHGDSACYEAMVLMAQSFSYRYPLIDGQGNFGSQDDPKSFAAMRYTESRLASIAKVLLAEVNQGACDWQPNFDGTLEEPVRLPARLPHVLLNGATGIAVGMATDIPPHQLNEVVDACLHLLRDPEATTAELCAHIKGPDYPGGAEIITSAEDLHKLYDTGSGSVRLRARWHQEDGQVAITHLPHQVPGATIMEQIARQMQAKKLPVVTDLRDESDHQHPVRLVLELRSNRVDIDVLMNQLFATTDLERTYRMNFNVVGLDQRPQVKPLKALLSEWLVFRTQTLRRRLQHRLDQVDKRLHVLEGLLVAFLNLDEVIRIIRTEDEPKPVLMARFGLSAEQADFILETRLRHLARLEQMRIEGEQHTLIDERARLRHWLGDTGALRELLSEELVHDGVQYGDARRCPLVTRPAAILTREAPLLPSETVTVLLSQQGWIRSAKGDSVPESLSYKSGDGPLASITGKSHQTVLFMDSAGRFYTLPAHGLPSARGYGEPLTSRLAPPHGACFVALLLAEPSRPLLLASSAGYGFIATTEGLVSRQKAGKAVLSLPQGATPLMPMEVPELLDDAWLVTVSMDGRMLIFPAQDLPRLPKGKGNKLMQLPGEVPMRLLGWLVGSEDRLCLDNERRTLTLKPDDWRGFVGKRGQRGRALPKGYQHPQAIHRRSA